VTVSKDNLAGFKKLVGNAAHEELGFVTAGSIEVDGMNWGDIQTWKDRYDNAIGNILSAVQADDAIAAL